MYAHSYTNLGYSALILAVLACLNSSRVSVFHGRAFGRASWLSRLRCRVVSVLDVTSEENAMNPEPNRHSATRAAVRRRTSPPHARFRMPLVRAAAMSGWAKA